MNFLSFSSDWSIIIASRGSLMPSHVTDTQPIILLQPLLVHLTDYLLCPTADTVNSSFASELTSA